MFRNQKKKTAVQLMLMITLITIVVLTTHAGGIYELSQSLVTSGGGTAAEGGYSMTGSIGQRIVGISSNGSYQISVGIIQENRELIFTNQFDNQ